MIYCPECGKELVAANAAWISICYHKIGKYRVYYDLFNVHGAPMCDTRVRHYSVDLGIGEVVFELKGKEFVHIKSEEQIERLMLLR